MKTIMRLKSLGLLTDSQVLAAYKFSRAPQAYRIAPAIYRVLHDAIVREEPLEAMEMRRGWPARSARAIIGLLLHALQEMGATHEDPVTMEDLQARLEQLTDRDNADELTRAISRYGFTRSQAQFFLILKRAKTGTVSIEKIMQSIHGDRADDPPEEKIVSVMVCHMRKKLARSRWEIENVRGVGYRLVRRGNDDLQLRRLLWYAQNVLEGVAIREIARQHDVAPSTVLRGIWKLVDEHDDDDALDAMAREAWAAREEPVPAAAPEDAIEEGSR